MSLHYIIDGYNITNHPSFSRASKSSRPVQAALLDLIRIKKLTGSPKNKVSVVFDGYPPAVPAEDAEFEVIFSRRICADERIVRMVEESSGRRSIIVVSDDAAIRSSVRHLLAQVMPVEEFIEGRAKARRGARNDPAEDKLGYVQMQKINEELRKAWL